jgi:DNA-binding transcriptional LysR family regulator
MKREYPHVSDIELFHHVAEQRSFTAAARVLGLAPSALTRAVARLEAHLGVRLLTRSTRQVRLNENGIAYLERTRTAFLMIGDAERLLMGKQSAPQGLLRISAPTTYGHYRLAPRIANFMQQYPQIKFEFNFSNRNIDFVAEGFDLAIRMGELADSNLIAHLLPPEPVLTCASPEYLAKHGQPKNPADLSQHQCLTFLLPSSGRVLPWIFRQEGRDMEYTPIKTISISEDALAMAVLAKQGVGICQTLKFVVQDELNAGRLVEVLQSHAGRARQFSLLYPQNRHLSAAVRTCVDALRQP